MNIINIHFKSISDFRNRICNLFMNQLDDETYHFTFEDDKVEDAFNEICESFGQKVNKAEAKAP